MMMVRVRRYDSRRMYCSECGKTAEEGEEVLLIDDMVCCLPCSIEYLLTRIENLERRVEELELQNGIAVPV